MIQQIPFDLAGSPSFARDDLVATPANSTAIDFVDNWPDWPHPIVALVGPVGSGKSHIAGAWMALSGAHPAKMGTLPKKVSSPVLLEDVERATLLDEDLFHLINAVREAGETLLMTARTWPRAWGVGLADLQSRLRAATVVELFEPDDMLLEGVLLKLMADRQMTIDAQTIRYLVTHMERSLASAGALVEALDRNALALKRPVTRRLAGEVLGALQNNAVNQQS